MSRAIHSPICLYGAGREKFTFTSTLHVGTLVHVYNRKEWFAINYSYEITFFFCFMLNPRSFSTFLSHLQAITNYFSHKSTGNRNTYVTCPSMLFTAIFARIRPQSIYIRHCRSQVTTHVANCCRLTDLCNTLENELHRHLQWGPPRLQPAPW